ncbi:MAG: AAA family ATPase, partial [Pseudomonas sp.]|nr:AAA family ATPase [Pseudomonas sp.]
MQTFFIAPTDFGVGLTSISLGLVRTLERAGLKVAVIGITSDHIAAWNWRPEESGVVIPDTLSALDCVM